jgi:cation transport ATPase
MSSHEPKIGNALADAAQKRTTAPDVHDHDHDHDEHEHTFDRWEAARIVFVGLAAIAVWFRLWEPFATVSVIGVAGVLVGGWPIFREAAENIFAQRMTMELSMSIALIAAAAIGEFFTALIITLFVLIAEVLEGMTVTRGRTAIRDLLDFLPRSATVRRGGSIAEVDASELVVDDAILVNPGGRVPVDGVVLSGHSFLDQSRITGESMPVEATAGAPVYAGSINQSGALEIRAERLGRDTSYGKIIEAVEQSERSRAPVQRLADQLAGYLVYFALAALGLRTILLTGDSQPVAKNVADHLGIAEYEADLLPEDKHRKVAALVAAGRIVSMLGDGINDAPALTAASVGVAMGSGTDVARESADMVLLGNDLSRFVDTLVIARRTRNIIWFNFGGTIVVDVIGVVLASLGLLNPLAAAFIHVASEMAFILNSARLLPPIDRQRPATHPPVALLEH